MTVQVQETVFTHTGNGITTVFSYGCKVLSSDDLYVFVDGELVTSGFTIDGIGASTGGSIAFGTAPADGIEVRIERKVILKRDTDYAQNGDFRAVAVNPDFDRLWMALQQIEHFVGASYGASGRMLRLGDGDTNGSGAYRALLNRIQDLADPVDQQDAANKQWVQTQLAGFLADGAGQFVLDLLAAANGVLLVGNAADKRSLAASTGASLVGYGTQTIKAILDFLRSAKPGIPTSPAYIEQFLTGFFGRGMLTAETINVATNQNFSGGASAGASGIGVANTSNFEAGGGCVIKYPSGAYKTHFILSKTSSTLSIVPGLYENITSADSIERLWYNRAHPGKYYMRSLAQRIARSTELDAAMPSGRRIVFSNFTDSTDDNTLLAVGNAAVNYYDGSNTGEGAAIGAPVRFAFSKNAYIDNLLASGDGARTTGTWDVRGVVQAVLKVPFYASSSSAAYSIQVIGEDGNVRADYAVPASLKNVPYVHSIPVAMLGTPRVYVQIVCTGSPAGYFVVGRIDLFEASRLTGKLINKSNAKIVMLGDSWVHGDEITTIERESICTQLALELPDATIINAGHGGDTIYSLLARFDTDVTPYSPDYVVVVTGTNDAYNPSNPTFDPNAITGFMLTYRKVLNKIAEIGARPIIVGVPALAQTDAEAPAMTAWQLNDRARLYERYFCEGMAAKPFVSAGSNANGSWTKFEDGTLICRHQKSVVTTAANTYATTPWTFPYPFVSAPKVTPAPASYGTNQVLSAGSSGTTATETTLVMVSGTAGISMPLDCSAVGRWK